MELTGKQWNRIEPIILQSIPKKDFRVRKPREVLNGILWVLRTAHHGRICLTDIRRSRQACHRRFQHWRKAGVFRRIIEVLAADLQGGRFTGTRRP